ncbi:hypothetical protein GCM10025865_14370 [Paraoerskovia sediminicola]|uniref:DUF1269 domain-containing protein n=1 Tax=Paraoerskovia sediminicola TaxID=1138587 RepID=A0ABN6XDC4_9CELL|nr:DUF6325 family protein [Paraoerskovia sediminicola]BDZ42138.1 hypothetical protein GCM10025865_14370 [Paraoerskovia sediminicola]
MADEKFGPVEFMVIGVPLDGVPDAVVTEVQKLVDADVVDLLDVAYVSKAEDGTVTTLELEEIDHPALAALDPDGVGLAGEEDLLDVSAGLAPGSAALVLVVEHTWARSFLAAVVETPAEILMSERITAEVVNEVVRIGKTLD